MTIKVKVTLITLAVFILSASIVYSIQRFLVLPGFYQLEREESTKNMQRVVETINRELQLIGISTADWAYWDDTYRFAEQGGNYPEFLESTLTLEAAETLHSNLINVYDIYGNLIWGASVDPDTYEVLDLGVFSARYLPENHPLLQIRQQDGLVAGLAETPSGTILVGSRNILKNDRSGQVAGVFVIGRLLDEEFMQGISEQTRLDFSLEPLVDRTLETTWANFSKQGLVHTPIDLVESADLIISETIVSDLFRQPLLKMAVNTPRTISARGENLVHMSMLSIGASGLLIMVFMLMLLHRSIVSPVITLTDHAVQVGKNDNLRTRLNMERGDEIGTLAYEFDRMTDHLAETRRKLMEQSYCSGMSEMASGVLHNVGNAVTPLTVRLNNLQDELRGAPAAEMEMAVRELAEGNGDLERREDLSRFVELAGGELASLITQAKHEIDTITSQVNHVQKILSDQEKYSRAKHVLEPLRIEELVLDGARMLSPEMQQRMSIDMDPDIEEVNEVLGSRTIVQQVIGNLLINAAESISSNGAYQGHLRVAGSREVVDGREMVHFRFEDSGVGIETENLKRIFERGFSTKNRGSGLGLHWCANVVNAMGGNMYAESGGPGEGLCMHLLLPVVPEASGRDISKEL